MFKSVTYKSIGPMSISPVNTTAVITPFNSETSINLDVTPSTPIMLVDENIAHRTLESYNLLKKLGSGAQGTVWKAMVKGTGRIIALKVLEIKNEQILEQTRIEINNLIRISNPYCHPYLACYYDSHYISSTRQMLIEMEYVDGINLNTWADRERNNRKDFNYYLAGIMIKLCEALKYTKSLNIIHRDIKPENILIDQNDLPKLVDFGLACQSKICETLVPDLAYTCCYGKVGTPVYMAPETVTAGEAFFASDIWSLGATIFNSSTGHFHYPFPDFNNIQSVLDTIAYNLPYKLTTSFQKLNIAVNSCLNKDPLRRINVDDLLNFLHPVKY